MGILSFLGGTAFRWLIGEALGWLKARDEHRAEMERMRFQLELDRDRHQQQQEAIAAHAAAGVKVIEAQTLSRASAAADDVFLAAVQSVGAAGQRGDWVGQWNAAIRPLLATVGILLIAANAFAPTVVVLSALVLDVICAVLGVFVGERIRQRGS